jgi:hypothetical protein
MNYFNNIPSYIDRIGVDLAQNISYSKELLHEKSPYIGNNLYSPLVSVIFIPFALLDFRSSYMLLTAITLLCYISMWVLAGKVGKISPEAVLIFATGLLSYGTQFEIERGQFYVLTMALLMWSLYLAHFTDRKYLAWGLFTVAVQLKIFPVFFLWLIVKRNWKDLFLLAGINFLLLFILGFGAFFDFLHALQTQLNSFVVGNHSIRGYLTFIGRIDLLIPLTLAVLLGWVYANWKSKGFDTLTIFYCTLTALLVPTISHDYSLPIMILPMVLLLRAEIPKIVLLLIALLYSSTLFSYASKSIMQNNGLSLLILSGLTLYLIVGESKCPIRKH